jgi:dTMP kinase
MKGVFVVFEGIDGAGKTSAINYAEEWLKESQLPYIRTREPGGTPTAEIIREGILHGFHGQPSEDDFTNWTEALLYMAARAQHVEKVIRPALDAGKVVICDRFCDSTFGHQGGGRGLDVEKLKQLHNIVFGSLYPDITFLLDGDPAVFRERLEQRGGQKDRLERTPLDFVIRSREVHLACAADDPERYIVVDAMQPLQDVQSQLIPGLMEIQNMARFRPTA